MVHSSVIVRPYGLLVEGEIELGLELVVEEGAITAIRPHTGVPDNFVVAPAFVNAHSHLEYRGLLDKVVANDYWPWIRELTGLKREQDLEVVKRDTRVAARENQEAGVALIAEHADRPFAGEALKGVGIGGIVFQEVITFLESADPVQKLADCDAKAVMHRAFFPRVELTPHASYTVDRKTLGLFGTSGKPISIHVAETEFEDQFFARSEGPIADFYAQFGVAHPGKAQSVTAYLGELGLLRKGVQFVHACAIDAPTIELMAEAGVSVAHCPRSNARLSCPPAPIREMLDAGIAVGLGQDSAASSGPVDVRAEMQAAWSQSHLRGHPLRGSEIWQMAANPQSIPGNDEADWRIEIGSTIPLVKISAPNSPLNSEELMLAESWELGWL